jgi:hypothetical protein
VNTFASWCYTTSARRGHVDVEEELLMFVEIVAARWFAFRVDVTFGGKPHM